jgi:hypothetical protein
MPESTNPQGEVYTYRGPGKVVIELAPKPKPKPGFFTVARYMLISFGILGALKLLSLIA